MSIEKVSEIQNPQEFLQVVLNFLDIKVTSPPNEKIRAILNEIFEILNNQSKVSRENLESRFVEKLSVELLKLEKKDAQNKLDSQTYQNFEKQKAIKLEKIATDSKNDSSKNETFQNKAFVNKSSFDIKADSKMQNLEESNLKFLKKASVNQDNESKVFENKFKTFLSSVKNALENLKMDNKSIDQLASKKEITSDKSSLYLLDKTLKINFSLFEKEALQTIKEQILFIQDKLTQLSIPLAAVGYHTKEKEKKTLISKKSKKKKKYQYPKQMKYKEENFMNLSK